MIISEIEEEEIEGLTISIARAMFSAVPNLIADAIDSI